MKRYRVLAAAVVMQMCLGATYSWSVYVAPLREVLGLLQGAAQFPFSVFYFLFPATAILTGTLLPRLGPRRCAVAGGVAFGGGWCLASLGGHHFGLTVLGVGVLAGVGAGLAYLVPIATCVQWFPRHQGLVTGVAVAGFGGGAALVSQVAGRLLAAGGSPFDAFRVLGLTFLVLAVAAGWNLEDPPGAAARRPQPLPLARVVRRPAFRVLYLAMAAGLAAGFTVNANLKELFPPGGLPVGVLAVSLFAVANAAGRVGWRFGFDLAGTFTPSLWGAAGLLLAAAGWVGRARAPLGEESAAP